MASTQPTWQVVLSASQSLSASLGEFRLQELISEVLRLAPGREPGSISPVVQGMTANAGQGPQSPCGKPLFRVSHGLYRLIDDGESDQLAIYAPSARRAPAGWARAERDHEVARRIASVAARFEQSLTAYDDENPVAVSVRYRQHRDTIELRRRFGSVSEAIASDEFLASTYRTLVAWGIGRRASRLVPFEQFRDRVRHVAQEIAAFDRLSIESPGFDVGHTSAGLWSVIDQLRIVTATSVIVPGAKTLHHLLPDLVPPMGRAWTGSFFLWTASEAHSGQKQLFARTFARFAELAPAVEPSRYVGAGWRTSPTKILDNAIVGYCAISDLRPAAAR